MNLFLQQKFSGVRGFALFSIVAVGFVSCSPNQESVAYENGEELSGGDTTVFDVSPNAFSLSARNLPGPRRTPFFVGNSFFNQNWVQAPSSTAGRDGLGPLFNTRSCSTCHSKDGRSPGPEPGKALTTALLRLSIPGQDPHGGPNPEPIYGSQLQGQSIPTIPKEGDAFVSYTEIPGSFADGESYQLAKPTYRIENLGYGPLHQGLLTSPRVGPAIIGLGLLELISELDLLKNADPHDANGDGISGRPNYVWDNRLQKKVMGRLGWKANQPSVFQQVATAFNEDIGITSEMLPAENYTLGERAAHRAVSGGVGGKSPELSKKILDAVVFYSQTLAVPARRNAKDPVVLRGKELFHQANCASCHSPVFKTSSSPDFPELSNQTIRPYSDLLLHDMGPELADNRPDFEASGTEWRTPPLWGIGLVKTVNGHTRFLHDGRARNLSEAILWHAGEAESSKQAFRTMSKTDRVALLKFLESL